MANGNRSNSFALFGGNAGCEKGLDAASLAEEGERTVAGADEVAGTVDDLLQDRFEIELAKDIKSRIVQSEEFPVLLCQPRLEPANDPEDSLGEEEGAEQHNASQEEITGPPLEKVGRDDVPRQLQRPQEEKRSEDCEQLEAAEGHHS